MATGGVKITKGKQSMEELAEAIRLLADTEVLVGFPEDTTARKDDDAITNAALGYIHDNGEPSANIPARPFMVPGIESARGPIAAKLAQITNAVVKRNGGAIAIETGLMQVGLIAQLAIKNKIEEGIPPPLADSTLRARARKRPNRSGPGLELLSRQKGYAPSTDFVVPLIDTGEMRNAVNFVIRSRKKRK